MLRWLRATRRIRRIAATWALRARARAITTTISQHNEETTNRLRAAPAREGGVVVVAAPADQWHAGRTLSAQGARLLWADPQNPRVLAANQARASPRNDRSLRAGRRASARCARRPRRHLSSSSDVAPAGR